MSSSTTATNVAVVLDHTGTLYAYTPQSSSMSYLTRTAAGSKSAGSINIGDSNLTSQAGVGVALAPATTSDPAGARTLFFVTDGGVLAMMPDDGRGSPQSCGYAASRDYNSIGVASLACGAVTASFSGDAIKVAVWTWDSLASRDPDASVTASYSASDLGLSGGKNFDGSTSASGASVALTSFIDAAGVSHLFMVSTWKTSDKKIHVLGHVIDFTTTSSGDTITCTRLTVSSAGLDVTSTGVASCPGVLQRPDGRLMVWYHDGSRVQQQLVTPTSDTNWHNDWDGTSGSGDVPAFGDWQYPCTVTFVASTASTQTSPVANALTNATVNVYDAMLSQDGDSVDIDVSNSKWGTLRRTAQAPQPQAQVLALGVIQGPPPVPLENINMAADYNATLPSATVAFSQSASVTSGMSANLGGSLFGKVGGSIGYENSMAVLGFTIASISAKAQAELSLGTSLMGTWSSSTTDTVTATIQTNLTLSGHAGSSPSQPNQYQVQSVGQIVGLSSSWASYVYDFVDAHGNTPSDGLSFVAVFPYQPSLVLTPYTLPTTGTGVHPGNLSSYQRSQSQLNELDAAAHKVGGKDYIQVSWSVGALSTTQAATYDEASWSVNLGLDLGLMLGAEAAGDVLGASASANASVDMKATFAYTWNRGSGSSSQFSSSVAVPGNLSAHGTYSAFGYRAYLLAESDDNLAALPAGAKGDGNLTVSPDSCPWLITYAVTSSALV